MDYQKIYDQICWRGGQRVSTTNKVKAKKILGYYVERHRIEPGNQGGAYVLSNIAWLTRKEHRLCHPILAKLNPTKGNIYAAHRMGMKHAWVNQLAASYQCGKKLSDLTKKKMSEAKLGKPSPTLGMKFGSSTGKKHSENNRGGKNPFFGKTHSLESREAMRSKKQKKWVIRYTDRTEVILGMTNHTVTEQTLRYLERTGKPSKKHGILSIREFN